MVGKWFNKNNQISGQIAVDLVGKHGRHDLPPSPFSVPA